MKKGIIFYIDADTDLIGFCGTIITEGKDHVKNVNCLNLNETDMKKGIEWYIPNGKKAIPMDVIE